MAAKDEYIYEAFQVLDRMSMDEEKRREYDAREKAIRDHNSLVKQYRNMGLEQGRAEGLEIGKTEGLKIGKAEGKAEGEAQTKYEISKLIAKLVEEGRMDLIQEMAKDEKLLDQLLIEYNLVEK